MTHYKSVKFYQILECEPPLRKRTSPTIEDYMATVLAATRRVSSKI